MGVEKHMEISQQNLKDFTKVPMNTNVWKYEENNPMYILAKPPGYLFTKVPPNKIYVKNPWIHYLGNFQNKSPVYFTNVF